MNLLLPKFKADKNGDQLVPFSMATPNELLPQPGATALSSVGDTLLQPPMSIDDRKSLPTPLASMNTFTQQMNLNLRDAPDGDTICDDARKQWRGMLAYIALYQQNVYNGTGTHTEPGVNVPKDAYPQLLPLDMGSISDEDKFFKSIKSYIPINAKDDDAHLCWPFYDTTGKQWRFPFTLLTAGQDGSVTIGILSPEPWLRRRRDTI